MTPRIAISVSYYGRHRKGDGQVLDADEHKEILKQTLAYLADEMASYSPRIVVCMSGAWWPVPIPNDVSIRSKNEETGNPDGSWWALCQGVRFAVEQGCEHLLHTCEDVLPHRGMMAQMIERMQVESLDYLGHAWRPNGELATQFFGCRPALLHPFVNGSDGDVYRNLVEKLGPEAALGSVCGTYQVASERYIPGRIRVGLMEQSYRHTHTPSQFFEWIEELKR